MVAVLSNNPVTGLQADIRALQRRIRELEINGPTGSNPGGDSSVFPGPWTTVGGWINGAAGQGTQARYRLIAPGVQLIDVTFHFPAPGITPEATWLNCGPTFSTGSIITSTVALFHPLNGNLQTILQWRLNNGILQARASRISGTGNIVQTFSGLAVCPFIPTARPNTEIEADNG